MVTSVVTQCNYFIINSTRSTNMGYQGHLADPNSWALITMNDTTAADCCKIWNTWQIAFLMGDFKLLWTFQLGYELLIHLFEISQSWDLLNMIILFAFDGDNDNHFLYMCLYCLSPFIAVNNDWDISMILQSWGWIIEFKINCFTSIVQMHSMFDIFISPRWA